MQTWLFYRYEGEDENRKFRYAFRRVESGRVIDYLLPQMLTGIVLFPTKQDQRDIERYVRLTGWIGKQPIEASTEVAQAVLKGRW